MCSILLLLTNNAFANESYDYTYSGVEAWGSDINDANTAIINVQDKDGNIYNTYCMDKETSVQSNHNYSIKNITDANYIENANAEFIRNIVSNAYPFISLEKVIEITKIEALTEEEAIAGTQAAIWHYANSEDFELTGNIKLLYDYYLSLEKSSTTATNISKLNIKYETYFEEGIRNTLIKIESQNIYDITYKFNTDLEEDYGAIIENVNNNILIKNLSPNVEFEITVTAKQEILEDTYYFYPENGRNASQSLVGVTKGTINVSNKEIIKIEDNKNQVIVNKLDSITKEGIENVTFKISNTSNFEQNTFEATTNEFGIATFEEIPNGTWYIKEITFPNGYVIKEEIKRIEVINNDVTVDIYNDPLGKIKIIKEDQFGERLDNIYFDLYKGEIKEENLIKKDIVTDKEGIILIDNLEKGKYILVETKTKEEYLLNSEEFIIEVEYGKTSEVKVVNKNLNIGNLIIKKIDSETNELLEGAKIGIYKDEYFKDLFLEITSATEEQIIQLPQGIYYIKELESPKGYILNLNVYQVEIKKDNTSILEIINYKIYNTALNHYKTLILGIIMLTISSSLYMGYKLWERKK